MPVIRVYRHGMTVGVAPRRNDHVRALRGDVGGWSEGSVRRNTRFLYSVDESKLTGDGLAVTLTLKHCPPDSDAWHRLRRAWEARQRRSGMVRMHWVTEWQRRGVPHLHAALWFLEGSIARWGFARLREKVLGDWVMLASEYGAGYRGQDAKTIDDAMGWFQYVSKHAARGVRHYQRSPENMPEAWQQKTGRMWGKVGDWPVQPELRVHLDQQGFWAYRRIARGWRLADARSAGDWRRVQAARSMLQSSNRALCEVRGVSEWIGQDANLSVLAHLAGRGFRLYSG